MKILTVTWNIFEKNKIEISKGGFSVMVANICEYIGKRVDSYLFLGAEHFPHMKLGNINVIDNGVFFSKERLAVNIDEWRQGMWNEFENAIRSNNIEFVFIHGAGAFNLGCVEICRRLHVPFAVVLHGCLLQQQKYIKPENVDMEKKMLSIPNIDIITVSHECRMEFLQNYPNILSNQISVIVNGATEMTSADLVDRQKEKDYNFIGKKNLVCVGSLGPNKNQIQLVRALSLLPTNYRKKIHVLLCGKDSSRFPTLEILKEEILKRNLDGCVTYIGAIPVNEMQKVYNSADGLVLPSINEGLSLVVLEAIQHGKPAIMFGDNETASDVNSPDATILVRERTDKALADAIIKWYDKKWDKDKILEYSKLFTMERVADDYIRYCETHGKK